MPFRILAGLICLGYCWAILYDFEILWATLNDDIVSLAAPFLILPLFAYVSLRGKLPDVLVKRLSDDMYEDMAKTETLFTKFDARSIGAVIVILIMGCYMIISQSG